MVLHEWKPENAQALRAFLGSDVASPPPPSDPVLVATGVSYCVTHRATDHDDGRAWTACRFRQLLYFENPMDEHTLMWKD